MKTNNKGFSLVEIIIAIAIIAILSSAIAISYLKYINKAAIVSDQQTCKTIEKLIYTMLTDDDNHDLYAFNGGTTGGKVSFIIVPKKNNTITLYLYTKDIALYSDKLEKSIKKNIPKLKAPREMGKKSYYLNINVYEKNKIDEESGANKITYGIGDITAETIIYSEPDEVKDFLQKKGYNNFYF